MTATELTPLTHDQPLKPQQVTAAAVVGMLRRHYLPDESNPAGIFAPEIQAPGPIQRKADLIWLGCTAATGKLLVGHEVKVSRADLLVELRDLTKSDPWERYCDRWYLVVPHLSLIEGLALPESWGVLLPPSGRRTRSMTVHRPAPSLKPDQQAPALRTIAAWVHWRNRTLIERVGQLEKDNKRQWQEVQELRTHSRTSFDPNRAVVDLIVRGLGGAASGDSDDEVGKWEHRVPVDDVVAALKDLGLVYERRDEVARELARFKRDLEGHQSRIAYLLGEMSGQGQQ